MATHTISDVKYGIIKYRRGKVTTGSFLLTDTITVANDDLINIVEDYTSDSSTDSKTIFTGRVDSADYAKNQYVTAVDVTEEILQVRPSGDYTGFTEVIMGEVINDQTDLTSVTCAQTAETTPATPDSDVGAGGWGDTNGNNNGDMFDDVDGGATPDDNNYIDSAVDHATEEFTFSDETLNASYNHIVYQLDFVVRAMITAGGAISNGIDAQLSVDGGSNWIDVSTQYMTFGWVDYTWSLTGLSYTQDDLTDLRIRITHHLAVAGTTGVSNVTVNIKSRCYTGLTKGVVESTVSLTGNKTLAEVFKILSLTELYTWYIDPDFEIHFDAGDTTSGESLVATDTMKNIIGSRQVKSYDKVILFGAYVGGAQITSTSGAGNIIWKDNYLNISAQSELDALAAQVLAEQGANTLRIQLTRVDSTDGIYQVGETIAVADSAGIKFSGSDREIPDSGGTTYIINKIDYIIVDGVYNYLDIELLDGLLFSTPKINEVAVIKDDGVENSVAISQVGGGESVGQANIGSNIGTDGVGVYDSKSGVTLQFRNIAPASAKITVVENGDDIDIDVGNIDAVAVAAVLADDAYIKNDANDETTGDLTVANLITAGNVDGKDVSGLGTDAEAHAYVEANALTLTADITFNAGQLFDGKDVSGLCTVAEAHAHVESTALTLTEDLTMSGNNIVMAGAETVDGVDLSEIYTDINIDDADDAHQAAAEATAAAALAAHHNGATDEHDGIYDTSAEVTAKADAKVSNDVYDGAGWNGVTTIAPSKDAVRDVIDSFTSAIYYKGVYDPGDAYPATGIGFYYIVSVDGYHAADGNTPARWYEIGDWIIYNTTLTKWDILRNSTGDNVINVAAGDDIQIAVDEIESVGAGVVRLMAGNHTVNAAITINDANVDIIIEGKGKSTVLTTVGDIECFELTSAKSCLLTQFQIEATSITTQTRNIVDINEAADNPIIIDGITITGDSVNGYGIYSQSNNITIMNCEIKNIFVGVIIFSGDNSMISNNYIHDNLSDGIWVIGTNSTVIGNLCNSSTNAWGIVIRGANATITGNSCTGIFSGIVIDATTNFTVVGNICGDNAANDAADNHGIYLDNGDYGTVIGNIIRNNTNIGAGVGYGIYIEATSSNNIISGNIIEGNDTDYTDDSATTILFGDDTVYGAGWNGDLGTVTKNAIYDKTNAMDILIAANTTPAEAVAAVLADDAYLKLVGDTMAGAINMGSQKITSLLNPTAAQDAATKNYIDTHSMIGAANSAWIPCVLYGDYPHGAGCVANLGWRNVGAVDMILVGNLPIPTTRGALVLYVKGTKIDISDSDANDYVDSTQIISSAIGGGWDIHNLIDHNVVHGTGIGIFTNVFAAAAVNTWAVQCYIACINTTGHDLDIHSFSIDCYYDAA